MQPYHRRGLRAGSCTGILNRQRVVRPARPWPPLLSALQGRPTRRRIPDVCIRQLPLLSDYGHRNDLHYRLRRRYMDRDLSDLYYVVEYLRATQDMGHILHVSTMFALRLYCEVDASYLLHPDSKGYTGYTTISFYGTTGTFHNRSVEQTAVTTSSTNAEARTIFTLLAKELNFLIALCQELQITLELPWRTTAR